jgi:hypothetical protein
MVSCTTGACGVAFCIVNNRLVYRARALELLKACFGRSCTLATAFLRFSLSNGQFVMFIMQTCLVRKAFNDGQCNFASNICVLMMHIQHITFVG